MSEDMQTDAVECATQALEKYNIEKDIAAFIKKEFDKKYSPTWHCIVGLYFLSNSFLMKAAMSFSMLYFSSAWVAQSTASCCISSDMSAFLITAFLSDILSELT